MHDTPLRIRRRWNRESGGLRDIAHNAFHLHGLSRPIKIAIGNNFRVRLSDFAAGIGPGGERAGVNILQGRSTRCVRDEEMRVLAFLRKKRFANEMRDSFVIGHGSGKLDVFARDRVHCHAGDRAPVGHLGQSHQYRRGRPFLREQVIVYANNRAVSYYATVRKRGARFQEICSLQRLVRRRCAMNLASGGGVIARRVRRPACYHLQLKCINQYFGRKLFRESGARIQDVLARYVVDVFSRKFVHTPCHRRQFLGRNAGELPRHWRRVDLKKGEAQFLPRTRKYLRGGEHDARLDRMKRCRPVRFRSETIFASAF